MKLPTSRITRLLLSALALLPFASSVEASIVAADSFSLTDERPLSSPVSGTKTEVGDLTWSGSSQWVFRGDSANSYMGTNGSGNGSIAVPFTFSDYQSLGSVATVSFSVAYRKQAGSWFGIGFSSSLTGGNIVDSGAVWLQINVETGIWSLRTNAAGVSDLPTGNLASAGVTFSTANSPSYTYSISYDSSTNTIAEIIINGFTVLSDYTLLAEPGSINSVAFFGQKPYNTVTGTQIDNFSLSVTPQIPESGSVAAVFALTAVAGLLLRRKMAR